MKFCTLCGERTEPEARFCSACGHSFSQGNSRQGDIPMSGSARGLTFRVGAIVAILLIAGISGYAAFRFSSDRTIGFAQRLERANLRLEQGVQFADKGERAEALKEWQAAVREFEAAQKINAADLHVRSDLGLAYLYVGKADKAIDSLESVLADDPNYLWAIFNLAWVYRTGGEELRAIDLYQRYLNVAAAERLQRAKYAEHAELIEVQLEHARAEAEKLPSQESSTPAGGQQP